MAKRLVQVAKELNVGTTTIVEHLSANGFEVDNNPRTKLTDEMYEILNKEFQKSQAIKQKANKITLGSQKEKAEEKATSPVKADVVKREAPQLSGLKVQGKIELGSKEKEAPAKKEATKPTPASKKAAPVKPVEAKKEVVKEDSLKKEVKTEKSSKPVAKKEETPVSKKAEASKPVVKTPEVKPAAKQEASKTDKPAETTGGFIERKRVELTGPKILGKINLPSKPVKKETPKKEDSKKDSEAPKRKRKRKKVVKSVNSGGGNSRDSSRPANFKPAPNRGGGGGNRFNRGGRPGGRKPGGNKDEVKEVSKKEIQDKIKSTMARIKGGGKNKRSKLRRDNRDRIREKQEELDATVDNKKLEVTEFIAVAELASLMNVSPTEVITTCMNLGVIVSINQRLDAEIIELLTDEFGFEVEFISTEAEADTDEDEIVDAEEDLLPRAPIVTVMGHVDHGKTSLLDRIRNANIADGEAGGITQHIGAYEVKVGPDKKKITFLDTPGHEAFTAMRARGAKVTDIAIIIVSADDSVMPQTKEAISHAQAAGVPMIFAINKIDKDGANPDRIKEQLSTLNYLVEEWGGKYQSQDISAKKGIGIEDLLEKVLLEAEMLELKANPDRDAVAAVLEASLEKGKGYATNILIQTGTLKIGDSIVAGGYSGKVKAMFNEHGKKVKKVGPASPVSILGLDGAPQAGEKLKVVTSDQEARQIASRRAQIDREQQQRAAKRVSLDDITRRLALGNFKELNLIVKGDFDGSIEALSDALIKQSAETVQVNVIHKAVGQIIDSDIMLASASDAIVVGFQVRPSASARQLAEREGVEIKTYSIIYDAIDEIKSAIEGMLEPTKEEQVIGSVMIREVFKISKIGTIAGCFVQNGKVTRDSYVRVIRGGIVVYPKADGTGKLASLKRFKDDVKEVKKGYECGLSIEKYNDIRVDDELEVYEIVEVKQKLK